MSFDLNSALDTLHQNVMEAFAPLLDRLDAIPALQALQPYRNSLPYLIVGLGLGLLLLLAYALRRKSARGKSQSKDGKGACPAAVSPNPPIRGRALDDMSAFERLSAFSETDAEIILTREVNLDRRTESTQETARIEQPPSAPPVASAEKAEPDPSFLREVPPPPPATSPERIPEEAPPVISAPNIAPIAVAPVGVAPIPVFPPEAVPAVTPVMPPDTVPDSVSPAGPSEVPAPPKTASAPSLIAPPESEFQRIYIEMYIDQELTTNFSSLRANVNEKLSGAASTEPLMPAGSANIEESIFAYIALAALDDLQTKDSSLESGMLSPHGQELCAIYDYALSRLRGSGRLSEDSAKRLLQETLEKVRTASGASS